MDKKAITELKLNVLSNIQAYKQKSGQFLERISKNDL